MLSARLLDTNEKEKVGWLKNIIPYFFPSVQNKTVKKTLSRGCMENKPFCNFLPELNRKHILGDFEEFSLIFILKYGMMKEKKKEQVYGVFH